MNSKEELKSVVMDYFTKLFLVAQGIGVPNDMSNLFAALDTSFIVCLNHSTDDNEI